MFASFYIILECNYLKSFVDTMNWTFINMPHLGRRSNLQNKKEKEIASKLLKQNCPEIFSLLLLMSHWQELCHMVNISCKSI